MSRLVAGPLTAGFFLLGCGSDSSGPEVAAPLLSAVSPVRGTVGTEVRIDGTGFTANLEVRFGNLISPRVFRQGGAVFALAPQGLNPGQVYQVHVLNDGVRADSANYTFTVVPPSIDRINGVTRPTGLRGMTIVIEGSAFGDSLGLSGARVFFKGADGSDVPAAVVDSALDWADGFVVTTVPNEIGDTSSIWIETATGVSDSVGFFLIQSGVFSPSLINWTATTSLPEPLHGLGAVFVPVETGPAPANYIVTAGGVDSLGNPVSAVRRATVSQNGTLSAAWAPAPSLTEPVAYHAAVAATPFTAAIDTTVRAAFLYVIGGVGTAGQPSPAVWYTAVGLDGTTGNWQAAAPLPAPLRSAGAVAFAGYLYVAGGADAQGMPQTTTYRARINDDGSLGAWQTSAAFPDGVAHGALVSFGPFLYSVGGVTGATAPEGGSLSGSESSKVYLARLDLRTRDISATGWSQVESMGKARSKHGAIFAGGSLFVTSGVYAGQPGSSENTYAEIKSDGTLRPWQGATGSETIDVELGISLYNQAVVTFIDAAGNGHVLVLGGADRNNQGKPSAGVVRY